MRNIWIVLLILLSIVKSYSQVSKDNKEQYIIERLPDWFAEENPLDGIEYNGLYSIDNRLNPLYLEGDFNGDGHIDIVLPIENKKNATVGFLIVHGTTMDVHILGAGTPMKNNTSESFEYIKIWKVTRERSHNPGLDENTGTGREGELIIETPAIQIEKSELGGGLIYWDGEQYAYFHQTC